MSFATDPRGVLTEPTAALRALCAEPRANLMENDAWKARAGELYGRRGPFWAACGVCLRSFDTSRYNVGVDLLRRFCGRPCRDWAADKRRSAEVGWAYCVICTTGFRPLTSRDHDPRLALCPPPPPGGRFDPSPCAAELRTRLRREQRRRYRGRLAEARRFLREHQGAIKP
jgi:hypothetical protein